MDGLDVVPGMSDTFTNPNIWLEDLAHTFDVICPKCSGRSKVLRSEETPYTARFVCGGCGASREWKGSSSMVMYSASAPKEAIVCYGGPFDAYFHYPLFLTANCCGQILWSYNEEHLEFLRGYVDAKLRKSNIEFGGNRTLASRLPQWMISKKNRDTVSKAIDDLRIKAQQAGSSNGG